MATPNTNGNGKANKAAASSAAVDGAPSGKKAKYVEVEDNFDKTMLWRGSSATSDLSGRAVEVGEMKTQHGTSKYVTLEITETSSWKNEDNTDATAEVGSLVKAIATADLIDRFYKTAERALHQGKSPDFVISFTGETKKTKKGTMKLYKVFIEPEAQWPALPEKYALMQKNEDASFDTTSLS